eukprot:SAG22_NODE_5307_length_1040_cov_2.311371_2_plen_80_part_01
MFRIFSQTLPDLGTQKSDPPIHAFDSLYYTARIDYPAAFAAEPHQAVIIYKDDLEVYRTELLDTCSTDPINVRHTDRHTN